MIRAVVFDMDGVLIDAREWHYQALNSALGVFGYSISIDEHLGHYDGLPTRKKLQMLTAERAFPRGLHPLINQLKQQFTEEIVVSECRPRFEHEFMLAELRRRGYLLGLASNSIRASIDLMLKYAGITGCFDLVLSNEDVQEAKPHPEIYTTAMRLLGVSPHETLVVEDNVNGIAAARAAGAHLLEVASPDEVNYKSVLTAIKSCDS